MNERHTHLNGDVELKCSACNVNVYLGFSPDGLVRWDVTPKMWSRGRLLERCLPSRRSRSEGVKKKKEKKREVSKKLTLALSQETYENSNF